MQKYGGTKKNKTLTWLYPMSQTVHFETHYWNVIMIYFIKWFISEIASSL